MRRALVLVFVLLAAAGCTEREAERAAGEAAERGREAGREVAEGARDVAEEARKRVDDEVVRIRDNSYEPRELSVDVGVEVTWKNEGQAVHTVTFENRSFDKQVAVGKEESFRLTQRGDYPYYCTIHGKETMSGVVRVT